MLKHFFCPATVFVWLKVRKINKHLFQIWRTNGPWMSRERERLGYWELSNYSFHSDFVCFAFSFFRKRKMWIKTYHKLKAKRIHVKNYSHWYVFRAFADDEIWRILTNANRNKVNLAEIGHRAQQLQGKTQSISVCWLFERDFCGQWTVGFINYRRHCVSLFALSIS